MPESRRYAVPKLIVDLLKSEMTEDNGYTHVPKAVYLGKRRFSEAEPTPFITLVESRGQPDRIRGGNDIVIDDVPYVVLAYIDGETDEDPTSEAYEFLGELQKVLLPQEDERLGNECGGIQVSPGYVDQDEKTGKTFCVIDVLARVDHKVSDPTKRANED